MKSIILLSFVFLLMNSCNPLSLDESDKNRKRDFKIDQAEGKKEFSLPDIKDISGSEVFQKTQKSCKDYETPFVSILGKGSLTRPIANCIAKALDEGLKPLCDQEEEARKALKYYEEQGDKTAIAETEEYLLDLEDLKYDTAEEIYALADVIDDQCDDWKDRQDKGIDNENKSGQKFLRRIGKFLTTSECGGLLRSIDHKARTVCRNLDISKIGKR